MKSRNDFIDATGWVALAVILSAILLTSALIIPIDAAPGKGQAKKMNLTVHAHATNGDVLSAYVVIKSDSTTVRSGFAPLKYTGTTGETYTVEVQDYKDWGFDKWDDGSTSNPRTLTLEAEIAAVAYFKTALVPVDEEEEADINEEATSDQTNEEATSDSFGVSIIHPTKVNGEQWFIDMTDPASDPRFDPKATITLNSDDSWNMKSTKVRMNVFTSTGYDSAKITTYDQKQLAAKGYMQEPNDWKNIEMTGFVKVNSSPSNDNFAWYARGGKHNDANGGCEGTSYKGRLFYDGKGGFAKEQQHPKGYSFTKSLSVTDSLYGKWIGFKTVMYNDAQGNVVLQLWLNENADKVTWKKAYEHVDSGGWGSKGELCGGTPDQKIAWGGPIATFRWDTATDVDFKWLSVREILVPET